MPLLTRYSHLKKKEAGKWKTWEPLRAVGLALERGLKVAQEKGLGHVTAGDLDKVHVVGTLEVMTDGTWQSAARTDLALRSQDSELSLSLLQDVRAYLHQKGFSATGVDVRVPGTRISLDMLGDCIMGSPLFVAGKVWVEVKVCSQDTVHRTMTKESKRLVAKLPRVQEKIPAVEAVLLLCAVVEKTGHTWGHTHFMAKMLGPDGWQEVSVRAAASRGRLATPFDLVSLWEKLERFTNPAGVGAQVALLRSFLEGMKLPGGNPGKRAAGLNRLLEAAGRPERLFRGKVGSKPGEPWLGSKSTFRQVSKLL